MSVRMNDKYVSHQITSHLPRGEYPEATGDIPQRKRVATFLMQT